MRCLTKTICISTGIMEKEVQKQYELDKATVLWRRAGAGGGWYGRHYKISVNLFVAFVSFLIAISSILITNIFLIFFHWCSWDSRVPERRHWREGDDPEDRMPTLTVVFQVSTKRSLPELGLVYHPRYHSNHNVVQNLANGCGEVGKVVGGQGGRG